VHHIDAIEEHEEVALQLIELLLSYFPASANMPSPSVYRIVVAIPYQQLIDKRRSLDNLVTTRNQNDWSALHRRLLRACPELDPKQHRDMNFQERKCGMFLAIYASSSVLIKHKQMLNIYRELRYKRYDIFQYMIAFL
jgi:hypothetical protein